MSNLAEAEAVLAKTRELCQVIVEHPEFANLRRRIDTFLADADAQNLFRDVSERGAELQQKQRMGLELADEEVAEFERRREALLEHEVAREFLDAQQAIRDARDTIGRHLTRTFELGRLPQAEDFQSCSCGSGCSCG